MVWVRERLGAERVCERRACQVLGQAFPSPRGRIDRFHRAAVSPAGSRPRVRGRRAQHIRQIPESKRYYDKKRAEGKRHNQAVRALGRHLVRVIWSMLTQERNYEVRSE